MKVLQSSTKHLNLVVATHSASATRLCVKKKPLIDFVKEVNV